MARLSLGFNYTEEHFKVLISLLRDQHLYPSQIFSIYGSPGTLNPFGSVRETYRENTPESIDRLFEWYIQLHNTGIDINYALNSLTPSFDGSPQDINLVGKRVVDFITYWNGHVDNWIISHPGLIDIIHEQVPSASIIVSTIMNVHTLPQIQWIRDNWPHVVRICPAIEKNRDFKWLKAANAILPLELLANEFCSMGGVECEGLYRQMCYMTQSMKLPGWCARDKCIEQRKKHPSAWLKAKFILPQWMERYTAETGVEHFKITGRTHGPEYLKQVALKYMHNYAEGNLLSLWGQLESTFEGSDQTKEQKNAEEDLYIPIGSIEDVLGNGDCRADACGRTCQQCDNIWEYYNGFNSTTTNSGSTKE